VLSIGATEQHGPHLPLDVDIRLAASMCEAAADRARDEICVVIAPPLPFGVSEHHMRFAGTVTLRPETFIAVVTEVGHSLIRDGFDRFVIVNGHGGNIGALDVVATSLRVDFRARHVVYLRAWAMAQSEFEHLRDSPPGGAAHACEYETSLYLHLRLPWQGEAIWVMNCAARCDDSRTREERGLEPRPLHETLADTVRWLVEVGHLTGREAGLAAA